MIVVRQHPSSRFFPRVQFRQEPARGLFDRFVSFHGTATATFTGSQRTGEGFVDVGKAFGVFRNV